MPNAVIEVRDNYIWDVGKYIWASDGLEPKERDGGIMTVSRDWNL